jgi:adrenodoxin-NADP+ reductase
VLDLAPAGREGDVRDLLEVKGHQVVTWKDYQQIDRAEVARGAEKGKPREKVVDVPELLQLAAEAP